MFNRCKHQWEEVDRSFTPGSKGGFKFESYDPAGDLLRMRAGETHIELKCKLCGDVGSRTLSGIHQH